MIPDRAPFATAHLLGVGGRIKDREDDFRVEEIPLYEAAGEGEHLYLTVEKRGMPTLLAARRLARALGCSDRAVGFAGLKDARAVTVQTFSFQGVDESRLERLELEGLEVLAARRHRNKIKKGHLRGNRFRIRLRGVGEDALERARPIVDELVRRGVPNLFGPQRFGLRGDTHLLGRAIVAGDGRGFFRVLLGGLPEGSGDQALTHLMDGRLDSALASLPPGSGTERSALLRVVRSGGDLDRALAGIERRLRELYLSAYQSELFNAVLIRRFPDYGTLLDGDLAWLHRNGAVFRVESAAAEQERADQLEISPSGPLFGRKAPVPDGRPGEIEAEVLGAEGGDARTLAAGMPLPGARRPLRVPLADVELGREEPSGGEDEAVLSLSFALPPGAYATAVLRELTREV